MPTFKRSLVVHGHFYQPPRENPWLGEIECQPSAAPAHDWNERILKECYEPNGCSRILNAYGKIEELVNNYEYLSFNFGPTLLNWIEAKHPKTYARIVEADRKSKERLGFGNAIAQVFNHIIMPLANQRDRLTQIRWGIADFERHFNRKPDCIWLAETAINNETVADLIAEGIRYVILAPSQAGAVRPMGSKEWQDVSSSNIDGGRTYRIFPKDGAGRPLCAGHLDAFFYDDGLSRAVSFERVLNESQVFADRIQSAFGHAAEDRVLTIATDGESYGHHHAYGDMCLAYLFEKLLPQTGIEIVNPAYYLSTHTPTWEVELKNGAGEGTAWSCAHGVGRWYRDCSCSTGAAEGWNQKWRTPLRTSLNHLRDQIDSLYEKEMKSLCPVDPWKIRDAYIEVIGKPNQAEFAEAFCQRYLKDAKASNASKLLKLLEMQKFMLYSFTSCGWFFNDFEGIEPLQNLKYARRAIDFAREISPKIEIESKFLRILRDAVSNQSKLPGDEIYRKYTSDPLPMVDRVIAAAIFHAKFGTQSFSKDLGQWVVHASPVNTSSRHILWKAEMLNKPLLEQSMRHVLTLRSKFHEDLVVVFPESISADQIKIPAEIFPTRDEVIEYFSQATVVAVSDLLPDHLMTILDEKAKDSFEQMSAEFKDFPRKYNLFYDLIAQKEVQVPEWISTPIRMSLNAEINELLRELLDAKDTAPLLKTLTQAMDHAERLGFEVHVEWIDKQYESTLEQILGEVIQNHSSNQVQRLIDLITAADRTRMSINRTELENLAYSILESARKKDKNAKALSPVLTWLNYAL